MKAIVSIAGIILALLLGATGVAAQEKPCPKGQEHYGGMATTSLRIDYGCYTPAVIEKLKLAYAENMCGEMGQASGNGDWAYSNNHKWVNEHCEEKETWEHLERDWKTGKEKWVPVSKDEYMRAMCVESFSMDETGTKTDIYPKPEWKECFKQQEPNDSDEFHVEQLTPQEERKYLDAEKEFTLATEKHAAVLSEIQKAHGAVPQFPAFGNNLAFCNFTPVAVEIRGRYALITKGKYVPCGFGTLVGRN